MSSPNEEQTTQIVKNASKAYGYNYASLADIAKAGHTIPLMRVAVHNGADYIEYFDGKDWQLGARVIEMDMKGMNAAQAYGSALTYARRYTVQMALGLVCEDDSKIETLTEEDAKAKRSNNSPDFDQIREELAMIDDHDSVIEYSKELNEKYRMSDKQKEAVKKIIAKRLGELK